MDFEAHDRAIISDLEADLAAARAEIERLTTERDEALAAEAEYRRKNHALTNERDEALAHVAAAFEAAAKSLVGRFADLDGNNILALTPAHARAALEAYGREKVREGMQRAADIAAFHVIYDDTPAHSVRDGIEAEILASMEKEGGE